MPRRILRVGLPDRYVTHGKPALLHEEVGFTPQRIAERIEAAILDRRSAHSRGVKAAGKEGRTGRPLAGIRFTRAVK